MFSVSKSFRSVLHAAACLVLLTAACYAATEQASAEAPKLYSPFDETSPKMPAEFDQDKRLDVKVDIAVKSTNMKDLFADLRKATGVSLVVAKEISGERPIVYFQQTPLRDVMSEISALYGYFWLAKGQKDAWTYELFEDLVHAKRREQVRSDQEAAKVEALLDAIDQATKTLDNPAELARMAQTNPRLYKTASDPSKQELLRLINLMDKETIRGCINDVGMGWSYAELSAEMKTGVLKTLNAYVTQDPAFVPYTLAEIEKSMVRFKHWRPSVFGAPHLTLYLSLPARGDEPAWRCMNGWPHYTEGESDFLNLPEAPPGRVEGDPLTSETLVTVKSDRKELYHGGDILLGHALEAVARRGKVNVIANWYFQEDPLPEYTDEPLDKLVRDVCVRMDYSCQVEEGTLRFRANKWFLRPLPEEPPMTLQEHWWRRVTETGGLSLDDLLDIACLRDRQTYWGGFRFIPQAWQARWFPRTGRMVRMLGSAFEDQACTPEGLSVSKLDADQFARLTDWANVMAVKEDEAGLRKCTIRIAKKGDPVNSLQFNLVLSDGTPRSVPLTAQLKRLSEEDRRTLARERAAELAADKVELSPHTPTH